jgi:tetraacyldisaccharide 4'-kinase
MHDWLLEIWYGERARGAWLLPLAWLFGGSAALRRAAYRRGWLERYRSSRPVVVVGNLTVGGTGKTPLVLWLVEALRLRGHHPGVVSRGYGRRASEARRVAASDPVSEVGDEPALIARRSGVPVAIGADRAAAVRLLEEDCDVILSDDGLQHYALARDAEIVVVDGLRGLGNGRLLPAGPLREGRSRLDDVQAVVVNGPGDPVTGALRMEVVPKRFCAVTGTRCVPPDAFRGQRAHGVAAIGHPERFFRTLAGLDIAVEPHAFPDHAVLTARDIEHPGDVPILMTEKDAVKCAGLAGPRHWYLEIGASLPPLDAERLLAVVEEACRSRS